MAPAPLLAIPPFPGARLPRFAEPGADPASDPATLLEALAHHRVGGCYWGKQRAMPPSGYVLDGSADPLPGAVLWGELDDPWPLLEQAGQVRLKQHDPRLLLALAARKPVMLVTGNGTDVEAGVEAAGPLLTAQLTGWRWFDPFDGRVIGADEAIALCGFWRRLIDANRTIGSVMGVAYWKKPTVSPLLWAGRPVPYDYPPDELANIRAVAVWRSRLSGKQRRAVEASGLALIEIEDGFIRSSGLGADCVPPLSIIVDALGPHFDPTQSSEIERILERGDFPSPLLRRAREMRVKIIASGLSKYESAGSTGTLLRPGGAKRHVLVPGQVEDDRAVTSGGALTSNLELLRRARAEAGRDAFVIYKPHPDVLAGHRRGLIAESVMAGLADHVETEQPMAALIEMVDELHVNSSLAGFEALLRGKAVTVHGVPFYAGWGLTTDRGVIPPRRTARRSLDELVVAALLLYPRYLDPQTGLPCPAEVLVERLGAGEQQLDLRARAIVALRRVTGLIGRMLRR